MPVLMSEVEEKRDGSTAIMQNETGRVFRDVHASSKGVGTYTCGYVYR
jgi:hypothetical protein